MLLESCQQQPESKTSASDSWLSNTARMDWCAQDWLAGSAFAPASEVGVKERTRKDLAGQKWIAKKVCYPEKKAAIQNFYCTKSVKITRTYAWMLSRIGEMVISHLWNVKTLSKENSEAWRKACYEGTWVWESQKNCPPQEKPCLPQILHRGWPPLKNF